MPALVFAYAAFLLTAFTGYVLNIIALVHSLGGSISALFIARCVGVFCPQLGAVLGLFA